MKKENNLIDFSYLSEMLYGEQKFLKEFCEAAILSFSEFKENYSKFLLAQNEKELRRAGHKIKPVAQMLKLDLVVDEYEHAKILITEDRSLQELKASAKKMTTLCSDIIKELKETISKL